jgi:hypothetical protein
MVAGVIRVTWVCGCVKVNLCVSVRLWCAPLGTFDLARILGIEWPLQFPCYIIIIWTTRIVQDGMLMFIGFLEF